MDIVLSSKDTEWLATRYPGLKIDIENKMLIGDIYFNRSFKDVALDNIFSIKVMLEFLPNMLLPKVYETSDKLQNIASKLGLENIEDIHVNSDDTLCLTIYGRENECFSGKFTIVEFFENCLESYLYWVTYYEKYGTAPWKEYAHGSLGFMELYAEDKLTFRELQQKVHLKVLSHYVCHYDLIKDKCLCGKNISMKKCHNEIYNGVKKFKRIWSLARAS
jgi:hypothetical protein